MKKLLATSTFLLVGLVAFSQPGQGRPDVTAEQIAQRQANALSQRLTLSEEQRSKAYSVYLEAAKKELAAREARMKEMQKIRQQDSVARKQQDDKISQLLTAEQKTKFQDRKAALGDRRGGPGGQGRLGQGGPQQRGGLGFRQGGPGNNQGPQLQGPPRGPQMQQGPGGGLRFRQGGPGDNRGPQLQGPPRGPQMQQGPGRPRMQMQQGPRGPQQQFQGGPGGQRQGRGIQPPPPPAPPANQVKPAEPAK